MRGYCSAGSWCEHIDWGAMLARTGTMSHPGRAAASSVESTSPPPAHAVEASPKATRRGRDFDFIHGEWVVANRRLPAPLTGSGEWISFHTTRTCRPLLDGLGNIDEVVGEDSASSAALRLFNLETRQWAIHCASSRDGVLRPPLHGAFDGEVGIFVGEGRIGERPILVRHTWTRTDREHPRWERAFSPDGGLSWETNWVMHLTRVDWP